LHRRGLAGQQRLQELDLRQAQRRKFAVGRFDRIDDPFQQDYAGHDRPAREVSRQARVVRWDDELHAAGIPDRAKRDCGA
jgi:hypothetical protein